MSMLTIEMSQFLLTHGVENISGNVRHFNRKVASQVVTWALTTWNFCSGNKVMKNNDDERMKSIMAKNPYAENDNSFY